MATEGNFESPFSPSPSIFDESGFREEDEDSGWILFFSTLSLENEILLNRGLPTLLERAVCPMLGENELKADRKALALSSEMPCENSCCKERKFRIEV
mmetsp:Transcript_24393/g.57624  ORF Transcript_24393/g.57624 Transcript_24393/m.57624 type:complete len:98 (-) Transcript_24393:70-363(-)